MKFLKNNTRNSRDLYVAVYEISEPDTRGFDLRIPEEFLEDNLVKRIRLENEYITIGRDKTCSIPLEHPLGIENSGISRVNYEVHLEKGKPYFTTLTSLNRESKNIFPVTAYLKGRDSKKRKREILKGNKTRLRINDQIVLNKSPPEYKLCIEKR